MHRCVNNKKLAVLLSNWKLQTACETKSEAWNWWCKLSPMTMELQSYFSPSVRLSLCLSVFCVFQADTWLSFIHHKDERDMTGCYEDLLNATGCVTPPGYTYPAQPYDWSQSCITAALLSSTEKKKIPRGNSGCFLSEKLATMPNSHAIVLINC